MYHLTCPSCQDKSESPFVRSGAVVRCSACENKYRIKSAHFEREVHTGPRTLDESDTVLRSDSVDIDPDEVAPVSIDDDGNVVGLSGLSELMRFSDEQGDDESNVQANVDAKRSKDKAKARQQTEEPLPVAKAIKPKDKQDKPSPAAKGSGRLRAQALKRKKRNQQYILLGCGAAVLIILGLIIAIIIPNDSPSKDALASDDPGTENTNTGDNPTPPVNDTAPDPKPKDPTPPDEVLVFSEDFTPSPNPAVTFQPPWKRRDTGRPPTDVPTVLTPAMPMSHEGWYVMTPPRGAADAPGDSNVELGQITATQLSDGQTLLVGEVSNYNTQVAMKGELHIMLLDSTGNVFAEAYAPLSMIKAKGKQPIALTIPTRYWKRNRGVRAGVQVTEWASEIKPMQGVQLDPIGPRPIHRPPPQRQAPRQQAPPQRQNLNQRDRQRRQHDRFISPRRGKPVHPSEPLARPRHRHAATRRQNRSQLVRGRAAQVNSNRYLIFCFTSSPLGGCRRAVMQKFFISTREIRI